ncbi:hydroxyisourate hydrolase [Cellulomonas fengjieae]|uniref:5-hydroxyisourate hydrolase n=1 Tax=Cellulomonas fengjieae TaxID=2819978 RepID=A0ABS3SFZ7_9CELL|nr:hydroxyisourate hydrolase [Cellulomonas fengjieae]MBO3084673.1 hydroxyisourate hydrolase [Cellulomonas fengjieae]MBO3103445.1 hydroxyisourate hydrolase [Cellulomonas fengjieae]QVI67003.1 hydroxyisourate hydrolase [Cellulomonas fengjieae]
MSQLTTHVLDTALGRPAAGVPVSLLGWASGRWDELGSAVTDGDGRARSLGPDRVPPGRYRLVFDTAAYFAATDQVGFHPEVVVVFEVVDDAHYHVPLLLSPFAYSTYRGS